MSAVQLRTLLISKKSNFSVGFGHTFPRSGPFFIFIKTASSLSTDVVPGFVQYYGEIPSSQSVATCHFADIGGGNHGPSDTSGRCTQW